jgi:aminomethyltransferase
MTASASVRAEFQALLASAGVYAPECTLLSLTGADRTRWLNGMVTNNVRDLAVGRGVYAFLLNPQGHILGDMHIFNRGESLTVATGQAQLEKVRATFDRYIIMDDVEVTDLSGQAVSLLIAGPNSQEKLNRAGFQSSALDPLQFTELQWHNTTVTLVRGDNPLVDSYEIWLAPDRMGEAQSALTAAGAEPASAQAIDLLRIASGIPLYGQDIRERDLPQETEQTRALHFSKGCYIGQEIVERIRSRGGVHRKFSGFDVQGELPAPRTKIQLENKDVGEITSAALLPLAGGDRPVALGYIRREAAMPGKPLVAGNAQLSVAALPFASVTAGKS